MDAIRQVPPGRPVLFFGVGPTLHHVFLAATVASEIHLGDYLPANLAEIRRWLDHDPGAHDWRAFVRYTLQCEGIDSSADADVSVREELTRQRVTRLVEVDGRVPAGAAGDYLTVISAYCADSDHASWSAFMGHILDRVAGEGLFLTAALRRSSGYRVGGKYFPSAHVDEHDVRTVIEAAWGAGTASVEAREMPAQAAHGCDGIVLGQACRPSPSLVATPPDDAEGRAV